MGDKDTLIFIRKATDKHKGKYSYSKTQYKRSKEKVIITCPTHGDFEQIPNAHLNGQGCAECGGGFRFTQDYFVSKAKKTHNSFYDYSKVNYVNSHVKVIITCPTHGDFEQRPYSHLNGHGCAECAILSTTLTHDSFISKCRSNFGEKYDYGKTKFITVRKSITITCLIHGDFTQRARIHLGGHGCPKCSSRYLLTADTFLNRAKKVHGDTYDYSDVKYNGIYNKITVICRTHGKFNQTPKDHLSKGAGCPSCSSSKGELLIEKILKLNGISYTREYRIPEVLVRLRYDFYLPEYKLLIEFHGRQHYEYIPHFHRNGEDDLLIQKNRDDIARYNSRLYKYRYFEISYIQLNTLSEKEFTEYVLKSILKYKKISEMKCK